MFDLLVSPFSEFEFMRRALVGGVALALSGAPVGVFLILRRMSLTGDAMAHAILPGAALGYLFAGLSLGAMTAGGLVAGLLVAVASGAVARATSLREDASLAAFYLVSLALGVTIVSLKGSSIDLLHVLFGNVLALDDATLVLLAAIASLTMLGLATLYRPLVMETVDPNFLASDSRVAGPTQIAVLVLGVMNLVAGFQALGTLLAVGLMMLPAASARLWTTDVGGMIAVAAGVGVASVYAGLVASFESGAPSGPMIILVAGVFYLLSVVFGRAGGLSRGVGARRHLEA